MKKMLFVKKKSLIMAVVLITVCSSLMGCESKEEKRAREARENVERAEKEYEKAKEDSDKLKKDVEDYREAVDELEKMD